MAVKLRLRRMGKKKQPIYKVVAADSRSPRDGKFLESIGLYNPLTNPSTVEINEERALYWLGVGAQPTDTVKNLFRDKGITLKHELKKSGLSEEKIQEELEKWAKLREASEAKSEKKADKKPIAEEKKVEVTAAAAEETKEEKTAEEPKAEAEEPKTEAPIEEKPKEEVSEKNEASESTSEAKGAASEEKPEKE